MNQCHISESLVGLDFKSRYNLTDYVDSLRPLIIFGMYRDRDMFLYLKHPSEVILVWQGSDAKKISHEWVEKLKTRKAKHYAISHWIKESLDSYGIESELKPISATVAKMNPVKKGNSIYFYSSDESEDSANHYGQHMIEEIKRRTGLNIIRGAWGVYPKECMPMIYSQCFINLRLTTYDGSPNGALEMGLMGIPSIFNGDIPGAIKWNNVDDICDSIWNEFINKDKPTNLHEETFKFLNIQFP
ncbi:MAG: hypothetical protein V4615_12350 [Bacteroidota bacterium]